MARSGFKTLGSRVVHDGHWLSLSLDRVRMPSGQVIENFHVVRFRQEGNTPIGAPTFFSASRIELSRRA